MEMKKYKLGDIAKIYDGPHATPKKIDQGPIYLGINAVTEDCRIDPNGLAFLSEEDYKVWTKRVTPQHKDIVFSYEATLGRYAIIPENFYGCLGRRLGIVRVVDAKVNYEWLFYYFQSPQWKSFIKNHTIKGSTVDRISVEEMPNYEVPAIDISKQNRIALVLSTLDKRIENLRAQNRVLEQTAKTIYDYTFLQCAGLQTTYNKTLNRNIPTNWEVKKLGDLLTIKNGKDHKHLKEGSFAVYGSGGLMRKVDSFLYDGESVLIPRKGTLNNVMYVDEKFWTVDTMFYTVMNEPYYGKYIYYSVRDIDFMARNSGTGVPSMTSGYLNTISIMLPDAQTLENFNNQVTPLFKKVQLNTKQIEALTTQRNTLLPLLMTGQVEVY